MRRIPQQPSKAISSRGRALFGFTSELSVRQVGEGPTVVLALVQHMVRLLRDRHVHTVALGQLPGGLRGAHALGDLVHGAENLVELAPSADLETDLHAMKVMSIEGENGRTETKIAQVT